MKNVIITGGAGFTGTNFTEHYLNQGCRVVVVDNLSRKGSRVNLDYLQSHPQASNLDVILDDIRKPSKSLAAAVEQADALFHFAGQVAVTTSVEDPREDFEINALGTFNMLELLRASQGKKPCFFFSSTNKVFGGMEDVIIEEGESRYFYKDLPQGISEERNLDFHSPYGCSKGAADQYVRDYSRIYGLNTVVFRQSCIYGYRQFGVEDQGWVAWFVIATVLNRPITIYGDGKQVRDVLFIEDLIAAYNLAWDNISKASGNIYNIGGGPSNTISLLDLIALLKEEVTPSIPISYADWRPGDQPVYVSDIGKAEAELGWRPQVSWEKGVKKLIDWVKENRSMLEELF